MLISMRERASATTLSNPYTKWIVDVNCESNQDVELDEVNDDQIECSEQISVVLWSVRT